MANGDRGGEPAGERVARLYGLLRPHLDERQRRLRLGAEAMELGRGGIKAVATGAHPDTVGPGSAGGGGRAGTAGAGARRRPQEAGPDRPRAGPGAAGAG